MGHFSLELPPTLDLSRLIEVLNDRLRRIAAAIEGPITLRADLDAAGHRLKDLADPRDGKDALSQHAADRRYMTAAATRELVTQTTAAGVSTTVDAPQAVSLSVSGTLSVRSNAAPLVSLAKQRNASEVVALVKQAPLGADLKLEIKVGDAPWATLTILAGQTSAQLGSQATAIAKDALIVLDVTGVGTTFPGADLTVIIRL